MPKTEGLTLCQQIANRAVARTPEVCELEFQEGAVEDPAGLAQATAAAFRPEAIPTLVICINDDSRILICALTVQRRLEDRAVPIFVRMATDAGLTTLFARGVDITGLANLHDFGTTRHTGSVESIIDAPADAPVRVVHAEDIRFSLQPEPGQAAIAAQAWEELSAATKPAYRMQADHIAVKLSAIGCTAVATDASADLLEFTTDEVEIMARMEHARRSVACLLACRSERGESDPTTWIPWTSLPPREQAAIRESVRRIPALLAQAGETIERRPAALGTLALPGAAAG